MSPAERGNQNSLWQWPLLVTKDYVVYDRAPGISVPHTKWQVLCYHCDTTTWPLPSTDPAFGLALCAMSSCCPEVTFAISHQHALSSYSPPNGVIAVSVRITHFYKDNTKEIKRKEIWKNKWQHSLEVNGKSPISFCHKLTNKTSWNSYLYQTKTQSSKTEEKTWTSRAQERAGSKTQRNEGELETVRGETHQTTVKVGMVWSGRNERETKSYDGLEKKTADV